MTLALVSTGFSVDGGQVLGVLGLNLFFLVVTVLHHRFGWQIFLADVTGIAVYVGLSSALLLVLPLGVRSGAARGGRALGGGDADAPPPGRRVPGHRRRGR